MPGREDYSCMSVVGKAILRFRLSGNMNEIRKRGPGIRDSRLRGREFAWRV